MNRDRAQLFTEPPIYPSSWVSDLEERHKEALREAGDRTAHYAGLVDEAIRLAANAHAAIRRGKRDETLEALEEIWRLE